jgi:hypothetical protein
MKGSVLEALPQVLWGGTVRHPWRDDIYERVESMQGSEIELGKIPPLSKGGLV